MDANVQFCDSAGKCVNHKSITLLFRSGRFDSSKDCLKRYNTGAESRRTRRTSGVMFEKIGHDQTFRRISATKNTFRQACQTIVQ